MRDDLTQQWCVAHQDPTPYMDGPRTIRMREVGDLETAEAMLEVILSRAIHAPREDLRIETRWTTPWERVHLDEPQVAEPGTPGDAVPE